jgi:multidrug efflux pump subunit AcrB
MTTSVNDIEHIESQSLNGLTIIKIFFQPHVNIGSAVAEVTAINQVQLRSLPPGSTPPVCDPVQRVQRAGAAVGISRERD